MQKQRSKILIFMIFMILGFSAIISSEPKQSLLTIHQRDINEPNAAAIDEPIQINGNSELAEYCAVNGSGSGTWQDPFIIENLTINANSSLGISITSTNASLIIRNCTVVDGNTGPSYYTGLLLNMVENVNVSDNIFDNNYYGIYLLGNSINDSVNNTISNNTCSNNQNYGIYLYLHADNNIISDNICVGNGERGIHLVIANNNTVSDNYCGNNKRGISISNSQNNTIKQNLCNDNLLYGIYFWHSVNNSISQNNCTQNYYGLYISASGNQLSNNTVFLNHLMNNSFGVYITESSNNLLFYNYFSNNSINAEEYEAYVSNQWDDGSIGNSWDDYFYFYPAATNNGFIWDTPYQIGGPGSGEDRYPLYKKSFIDSDGDGLTDEEEISLGTDIYNADTDGDGLTDKEEVDLGTFPTIADSDGDGISDGQEVADGTDPLVPEEEPVPDAPMIPSFGIWNTILVILSAVGFIIWKTSKKKDY